MTRQETINKAVAWAVAVADDPAHGYDQQHRWGADYDCSSFVITAWQQAGVPVKTSGASYTGDMYWAFIRCGFRDVTNEVNLATGAGLQKGDVLLNKANHTEMFIGSNRVVKASINEKGSTTGGMTGDQNGREIYIGSYYNYPWDCVLRYMPAENSESSPADAEKVELPEKKDPIFLTCCIKLPQLMNGDKGEAVRFLQTILPFHGSRYKCGVWGADGDFGPATQRAVEKFQKDKGLVVDSIVGEATWAALLKV